MTADAAETWQQWHERRIETVSAPHGPLSLVGRHWIEGVPDGRLPGIPGRWTADGDGVVLDAGATEVEVTPYDGRRTVRVPNAAVSADSASGDGGYRFRFLRSAAPDAEGRTTVDFNRPPLPPCAFADHFVCPFPLPGNTLDLAIAAGERDLRQDT
ncbi:DUF1684 domain-containing protein [Streptomyces turgidiscabies]|uniref:Uncharacterized protein (DUF1684 family) n=1 Tax=Streptomyces turgidiscabies TaxID=85558 RepID=A0ABU0S0Y2_9ACTN|nr:DUF1684 domain-containing protein [Streptomyces turgidiscabies]MDQ0937865.1 uncharacterized protein (DUF1684 family) [Streptomyces turgidiscabies]